MEPSKTIRSSETRAEMAERYGLFGLIPKEREVNERAMSLDEQAIGDRGETLIYETDNTDEARAIYQAGGFERNGVWHVVTRVEDRTKRAGQPTRSSVPSKRDYDQS
jgi:hypothetical protein